MTYMKIYNLFHASLTISGLVIITGDVTVTMTIMLILLGNTS